MEFADGVVQAAWNRQGGRCAKCGRWLIWKQRGRESMTGAWQPHHRDPEAHDKRNAVANCIIFCSGMADCHFKEGHGGVSWTHHACLDDSKLLYLHTGEEIEKTPKAPTEDKGSLIGAFLGISQAAEKKRPKRRPYKPDKANSKQKAANNLGTAADL